MALWDRLTKTVQAGLVAISAGGLGQSAPAAETRSSVSDTRQTTASLAAARAMAIAEMTAGLDQRETTTFRSKVRGGDGGIALPDPAATLDS